MEFQSPAPTMHRALALLQNKIGYCLTVPGISNRCVSQAWALIFVNWLSSELVDFRPSKPCCQILLTCWAVVCFGSHGMEKNFIYFCFQDNHRDLLIDLPPVLVTGRHVLLCNNRNMDAHKRRRISRVFALTVHWKFWLLCPFYLHWLKWLSVSHGHQVLSVDINPCYPMRSQTGALMGEYPE